MDKLYIRYATTNSVTQLLDPLNSGQVLRLRAHRSLFQDPTSVPDQSGSCRACDKPFDGHTSTHKFQGERPGWIDISRQRQLTLDVDFLSLDYGRFTKKHVVEAIASEGAQDLPVQELDILIESQKIGKAFATLLSNPDLEHRDYVAHFVECPLRREEGDNDYTRAVEEKFQRDGLGKLGFEPASLDLMYVLPLDPGPYVSWKQVVRGHLGKDLVDRLNAWQVYFGSLDSHDVRDAALSVFPRGTGLCSGREYHRLKGDKWTLVGNGDI